MTTWKQSLKVLSLSVSSLRWFPSCFQLDQTFWLLRVCLHLLTNSVKAKRMSSCELNVFQTRLKNERKFQSQLTIIWILNTFKRHCRSSNLQSSTAWLKIVARLLCIHLVHYFVATLISSRWCTTLQRSYTYKYQKNVFLVGMSPRWSSQELKAGSGPVEGQISVIKVPIIKGFLDCVFAERLTFS